MIMTKRFLFRTESFGGMILDRDTGLELMLNPTAFLISYLYIDRGRRKNDVIKYISEHYLIGSDVDLSSQIDGILKDVFIYFSSENGKITKWNSKYCPVDELVPLASPVSVFWEITSECNLRCLHCYNSSGKKASDDLNTKECIALMNELADIGVLQLIIGGGEGFCREDFLQILNLADDLGFRILIATNGTLLNPKVCQNLAKLSRLSLQLSIHHYIPEKHDYFCGKKGTFTRVLDSVHCLNENNIDFGVQSMITEDNQHNLREFLDFIISIGARSWHLKNRVNLGRERINRVCMTEGDIQSIKSTIDDLIEANRKRISIHYGIPMQVTVNKNYEYVDPKNVQVGCGPGIRNCGILPNGYLVPCSFLRGTEWLSEYSVREVGFRKLWSESKIFKPFRELNSSKLGLCNTCSLLKNGCNGGCRARAYNECGDFYSRDPQCQLWLKSYQNS